MFSVSKLLETIPEEGTLEVKKLEKILKLSKKSERDKLLIAIKALNKLGIIQEPSIGELQLQSNEELIEARLRCSTKGYCFAIRSDGKEDIYIRDQHLNNAWHGDNVLVRITREGIRRRSPEGQVQCILDRNASRLVCIIDTQDETLLAIPLEERILASIKLDKQDSKYLNDNLLESVVEVAIDKYPIGQYQAEGHVIRQLPLNNGFESDNEFLLSKVGITQEQELPRISLKKPSIKNRIDLTSQPCMILKSWKDSNSPPLPAFHAEAKDGGIKLSIHIPTVSERIAFGSSLDLWLRNRGEAFCLGTHWKPLLSPSLQSVSSLKVDEINSAITLSLDIGPDGSVNDWQFNLTSIKPIAEINPEQLEILNSRKPNSRTVPIKLKPIKEFLSHLETLIFTSELISKKEKEDGGIELFLPVPEIDYLSEFQYEDPSSNITEWHLPFNKSDPQSIISPLIRLANYVYSLHANDLNLPSILIHSQQIDGNTLNDIAKIALALDLELELDEEGVTSASELAETFSKNPHRRVLDKLFKNYLPKRTILTSKSLQNINLGTEESGIQHHISTPWCSPGNHYYDILNQYVLTTLLNEGKNKLTTRSRNKVELGRKDCSNEIKWDIFTDSAKDQIESINTNTLLNTITKRRTQANQLSAQIVSMAKSRTAENLVGKEVEATISGVQSYGFFAELPPHLSEGLVHVSSLNDDWYEYRSRQNRLIGRKSRRSYQLGDSVKVKVIKVDILRNQIDLDVIADEKPESNDTL